MKRFKAVVIRDLTAETRALSELELRFIELLRECGIEMPEINHDVERMMVDAVWHDAKLIVELDSWEFHKLPRDQRVDNARTRRLILAGYKVVRFVWSDVAYNTAKTGAEIQQFLAQAAARSA